MTTIKIDHVRRNSAYTKALPKNGNSAILTLDARTSSYLMKIPIRIDDTNPFSEEINIYNTLNNDALLNDLVVKMRGKGTISISGSIQEIVSIELTKNVTLTLPIQDFTAAVGAVARDYFTNRLLIHYMIFDYDKTYNPIIIQPDDQTNIIKKSVLLENVLKTYIYITEKYYLNNRRNTNSVLVDEHMKFKLFNFYIMETGTQKNVNKFIVWNTLAMGRYFGVSINVFEPFMDSITKLSKYTSAIYNIYMNFLLFYNLLEHVIIQRAFTQYIRSDQFTEYMANYVKQQLRYNNRPDIINITDINKYYGRSTEQDRNESVKLYHVVERVNKLKNILDITGRESNYNTEIVPSIKQYAEELINVTSAKDIPLIPTLLQQYISD